MGRSGLGPKRFFDLSCAQTVRTPAMQRSLNAERLFSDGSGRQGGAVHRAAAQEGLQVAPGQQH
eukprot:5579715-Lingulodinium_polyedra.AAC.1